jgi:hypothetical protein
MTTLKVTLPDSLAREAESIGLLRSEVIEHLLREEIRRRRVGEGLSRGWRAGGALGE